MTSKGSRTHQKALKGGGTVGSNIGCSTSLSQDVLREEVSELGASVKEIQSLLASLAGEGVYNEHG